MSDRYSWIQNEDYDGSYDRIGHKEGKKYRYRDNKTGETFPFPEEKIIKVEGHAAVTYEFFSSGHNSEEFIDFCCETAPSSIWKIPYEQVTPKIAKLMIEVDTSANAINYIPKKILTPELIETMVKKFPDSILHIPRELFDSRLYEIAIGVNGNQIEHMPVEFRTTSICLLALSTCSQDFGIGKHIPKQAFTLLLAQRLIDRNPRSIVYLPEEYITKKISEEVIKKCPFLLKHIPNKHKTKELCLEAYKGKKQNIKYMPVEYITDEMINETIDENPLNLHCIPIELITYEICEKAVNKDGLALKAVPEQFKTYELCEKAVINSVSVIEHVPIRYITHELLQKLESYGIELPDSVVFYVQKALRINFDNQEDFKSHVIIIEDKDFSEFRNITLSSLMLNSFISDKVLRYLANIGIYTLEELFLNSNNPDFISELTKNRTTLRLYHEVLGTTRLLKAKYLSEDPQVRYKEFDDNSLNELGLTFRTFHQLYTSNYNGEEIYEMVKNEEYDKLGRISGIGQVALEEIKAKFGIVIKYYEEKALNEKEEDIRELFEELQNLIKESQRISIQIEVVNEKIRRKTLNQMEGVVLRK